MFLFVIAYIGRESDVPRIAGPGWQAVGAVLAAGAILTEIVVAIGLKAGGRLSSEADVASSFGSPADVGRIFLTDHLVAFEVTSIVLLAAAVGGVVLGSHARGDTGEYARLGPTEPDGNARP
jgi:NADH:ubiquinone oxidoreductase subunit 6 (subunit J)